MPFSLVYMSWTLNLKKKLNWEGVSTINYFFTDDYDKLYPYGPGFMDDCLYNVDDESTKKIKLPALVKATHDGRFICRGIYVCL